MRYAATLTGLPHVLESIKPCLDGDAARMRCIGTEWVLESSEFQTCESAHAVFPVATALLARVHSIFTIYLSLFAPLQVVSILTFDGSGTLIGRRIRAVQHINVYSSVGLGELSSQTGSASFGSTLLAHAITDTAVAEALALVQDHEITWPQVYDIIEFLGGADDIARTKLALREATRRVRQTANYYRHLGRSKPYPLPGNPPTLAEARAFATDILKKWLVMRVKSAA